VKVGGNLIAQTLRQNNDFKSMNSRQPSFGFLKSTENSIEGSIYNQTFDGKTASNKDSQRKLFGTFYKK